MNLIHYAKQLLSKEHFLTSSDRLRFYRLLNDVYDELRRLQLHFALHTDKRCYHDLERLIIRVNNRMRVLPYE